MKQSLSQKLQQKLTPQQILLMKLIQLPASELETRLKKEIEENPAIEEASASTENDSSLETEDSDNDDFETEMDLFDIDEDVATTVHDRQSEGPQFYSLSVQESLQEDLMEQLTLKLSDEEDLTIGAYLIGSLDDAGYLRRDLTSIVDDLAFTQDLETSEEKVEEVLSTLQELEPAGVGARDLQESLKLQLLRKDQHDLSIRNASYIIENLFDDFTHRRYEKIQEKINISEEDLKEVLLEIQHLNPKPGEPQMEMDQQTSAITPDFNLSIENDEVLISLNNSYIPQLNINQSYLQALERKDKAKDRSEKETLKFIKSKVESAQWFIDAIRQREQTLMKSMSAIADRQKEFFLTGDEKKIRPMILKDIADVIEMDISTVSRVVNSKYVETPYGIFQLKRFFSESFTKESGEEVSTIEVKQILREKIEAEDKTNPLKDDQLTEILKSEGYPIARRTVAKYREQLGIPVARLRRKL
jgi:RNA polymerase sigma-54 factor